MANLLAHALFALALFSAGSSPISGAPLTAYGFYAAFASLAPDLGGGRIARRTPYGHSLAYGFVWALLVLSLLSLAAWTGLVPTASFPLLVGACLTGLVSHLFLDALTPPGIWTWPRGGARWGRFVWRGPRRGSGLNLSVSAFSLATILALLILY
ncbi:MAG: metal-dependent hydrolase [Thermoplasmata archaeon]